MMKHLGFAALLIACGGSNSNTGPDAGHSCLETADCPTGEICSATLTCIPAGTCAVDGDCGAGMQCTAAGTCEIGGCGGETLDLTYVAPNFLVVLDRSCSMDKTPAGASQTKWASAVGALGHVLTTHATDIDWGLTLFPDITNDRCTQDAIPIPIGPGQAPAIKTLLDDALVATDPLFPAGPCVTNIDTGIQQAALDPALADPARARYVMLVTDGAQSGTCDLGGGNDGTEAAITDLLAHDIKTFVVGFGGLVNATQLNRFATAGGAPLAGATKYYQADTAAQLDQVFQSIAELVVSCEYEVTPAPDDLAKTFVFFDNTELVPRDASHGDGWDYDPATMKLTLYGAACERLQTHQVSDVDVVYGCPVPPVL